MMSDAECVDFLQWALPQLGLRWPGFRKVRGQVRKRLNRRLEELGLEGIANYQEYLQTRPAEWAKLDEFCRISISRFYRDRTVFDHLRDEVLPTLAEAAVARRENEVRCWSAGCASGEEIYTVVLLWHEHLQPRFPGVRLQATATDVDEQMLQRAQKAEYSASSLKDMPSGLRERAFIREDAAYVLRPTFREKVAFVRQDIRKERPGGMFDLVLCRNLTFTYFAQELQQQVLGRIVDLIAPCGFLVVGKHETPPETTSKLTPYRPDRGVYQTQVSLPLHAGR